MNLSNKLILLILFVSVGFLLNSCGSPSAENEARPVYVWSHNDYWQVRPLYDALERGFQMIEADIHLIDGELYVAHDPPDPDETPILTDLYLEPLSRWIEQNDGIVLPESELPFYLAIDVKTEAESTFEVLLDQLEPYRHLFTRKENGEWIEGPVKILMTGNRPALEDDCSDRMVFIDGRIPDLGEGKSEELYPVISDHWGSYFTWDGRGEIPEDELRQLESFVEQAHEEDKIIRFWATPDREAIWQVLYNAGVDIINVDDLEKLSRFLKENDIPL